MCHWSLGYVEARGDRIFNFQELKTNKKFALSKESEPKNATGSSLLSAPGYCSSLQAPCVSFLLDNVDQHPTATLFHAIRRNY